ncbi:MAG TPA: cytidine deaminase [Thermoanaerobaculia bacterium]|jgi:cytidine deaminase|nr:cytidine deaminase [Thermoanaerobaculia bacterium]
MDWEPLIAAARAARAHSYSPYSGFPVGAAILMEDGSIWAAANVENCIPALAICAERNAMSAAASAGLRHPRAVVVITATDPPASPCGLCRQTLSEFADDLPILLVSSADPDAPHAPDAAAGTREEVRLIDLLPRRFRLEPAPRGRT